MEQIQIKSFILKVASRCNLNCSYCYMYHKGDDSWRARSRIMTEDTFAATIENIRDHCTHFGYTNVSIGFHGGEPTLIGAERFSRWCRFARQELRGVDVKLAIQTNATLLSPSWTKAFSRYDVRVGVSMDGPQSIHDTCRVDHQGKGSHGRVIRGVNLLRAAGIPYGILCVTPLGADDPVKVHRHFLDLEPLSISYLFPDETYESIGDVHHRHGPAPVADFLIPVFDDWLYNGTFQLRISPFWEMARAIRGGDAGTETLQNGAFHYLVIETDGEIHGSDVLRICEGQGATGMNVKSCQLRHVIDTKSPITKVLLGGVPLAATCASCVEQATCGGGFLPHRYSRERGFNNPSVWCADLLRLFTHIRTRMGVSRQETDALRKRLSIIAI